MAEFMTEAEQRDAARIAARRAREADRVQRFLHNPFNRQVGQDYNALREQIREKEERDAMAANQAQEEIEQQRRIAQMMDAAEMERREEDARNKAALRASWQQAAMLKADQRAKAERQSKVATERSGWQLAGEDPFKGERNKMQAIQMQRWCEQQMTLKQFEAEKAAKENDKYLRQLAMQEALRERVAQEQAEEQKRVQAQVRAANLAAAQQRRDLASRERKRALQAAGAQMTTEGLMAQSAARTGEFKGLTAAQKQQIKDENNRLIAEAEARKRREREEALEHGRMLRQQATYAQRYDMEDQETRRREREQHLAALQVQAMERAAAAKAAQKRAQKPGIGAGFYDGFGRSSR